MLNGYIQFFCLSLARTGPQRAIHTVTISYAYPDTS